MRNALLHKIIVCLLYKAVTVSPILSLTHFEVRNNITSLVHYRDKNILKSCAPMINIQKGLDSLVWP